MTEPLSIWNIDQCGDVEQCKTLVDVICDDGAKTGRYDVVHKDFQF